jgi:hypothetical protein
MKVIMMAAKSDEKKGTALITMIPESNDDENRKTYMITDDEK